MKTLLNSSLVLLALFAMTVSTAHCRWLQLDAEDHLRQSSFQRGAIVHGHRLCDAAQRHVATSRVLRTNRPSLIQGRRHACRHRDQEPIGDRRSSGCHALPRPAHHGVKYRGVLGWHPHRATRATDRRLDSGERSCHGRQFCKRSRYALEQRHSQMSEGILLERGASLVRVLQLADISDVALLHLGRLPMPIGSAFKALLGLFGS